jgi:acyl-coenzyme A thioesterase PaaI-like protein
MATPADELRGRIEAATAMRRLSHAMMAHQVDDATLAELASSANQLADRVEGREHRQHPFKGTANFSIPEPDGEADEPTHLFADSIVSGRANPMGMEASLWKEGDEAVMEVVLGPAFEGAPDRAHGGVMAALIDELMGQVLGIIGTPAFTGRLTVTYRNPTPLGVTMIGRARATDWTGRKITMTAEMRAGELLIAEAEALFIAVSPEHFASGASSTKE